jgi:hypothetical protein
VFPGDNGLLCQPFSPKDLAQAIDGLWRNPGEIERLGENNRSFGAAHCAEANVRSDFADVLRHWDIPVEHGTR